MLLSRIRFSLVALMLAALLMVRLTPVWAQHDDAGHAPSGTGSVAAETAGDAAHAVVEPHAAGHGDDHGHAEGGDHAVKPAGTFDPHGGTWVNPIARLLWGKDKVHVSEHDGVKHYTGVERDFATIALLLMVLVGVLGVLAARRMTLRPEGKPMSLSHIVETAAEGFRSYLIGIMGTHLGSKYAPLISAFFFTILLFNWTGLIPGMMAPTANPNIPIAFAVVAFVATHFIAIKETGVKSWFMHFVGEPVWLAPLNFPLHIVGELIKPLSLSIRLLCNVFGEEMVAIQLIGLAVATMAMLHFPIPFQLPMLLLGSFFGLLQALVFSTLLAIYISVLSTHHDDHDEHNVHGHVEHVDVHGFKEVVAHPSQSPVA